MKSKNRISTSGKFWLKVLLSMIVFSIIFALLFFLLYQIVSIRTWEETDKIYLILKSLQNFIIPTWFLGIIIIFIYNYHKTISYINTIEKESYKLLNNDNSMVSLPKELETIQNSVNFVKTQSIKNRDLALEEEKKKNELIVYLAHDLKTPLTSIIGYLDLLIEDKNMSENKRKEYLKIVMNKSTSLEHLINELFEITKLNSADIEMNFCKIDLQLFLEQVIDDFYPMLKEKNKTINLVKTKTKIYMKCDTEKLFRAFSNLIKNAINYSPDWATITMKTSIKKNEAIIRIENPCENISQEELKRMFDKFYRCDSSRNSNTGGTGLGLAITKAIIEKHDGTIRATYDNNVITFMISLPILRKN